MGAWRLLGETVTTNLLCGSASATGVATRSSAKVTISSAFATGDSPPPLYNYIRYCFFTLAKLTLYQRKIEFIFKHVLYPL